MLLRRITAHVKEQNWFAVGIDLLIVVVGVFIGIQVANWNEEQGQRFDATVSLERLHEDFNLILGQTERSLARHEDHVKATARVLNGARKGEFIEESLLDDLQVIGDFSVPSGPSVTYRELVAAGRLKFIENQELRRSLKSYDDYVSLVRSEYGVFTDSLTEIRDVLFRAQTLEASGIPSQEIDSIARAVDVDRALLSNDPEIRNKLQIAYSVQDNIYAVLYRNQGEIKKIIKMIETEMN